MARYPSTMGLNSGNVKFFRAFRSSSGRLGSTRSTTLNPDGGAAGNSSDSQTDLPTSKTPPSIAAVAVSVSTHRSVRLSTVTVGDAVKLGAMLADALDDGVVDGKALEEGSGDAEAVGDGAVPCFSIRIAAAAIATVPDTTSRR